MTDERKIRVLHVFKRMDRGGAEIWIVNVMRHIDRERYQFDFAVDGAIPGVFDDEIRGLGGKVLSIGSARNPLAFVRNLHRVMSEHGPYDVVHSHVHHFSGVTLALGRWLGVPVRIAHSHNDLRALQRSAGVSRRVYYRAMEWFIASTATVGLAASADAAASLFGPEWEADRRFKILHCGIDLEPYTWPVSNERSRRTLDIPPDAFVVGHVGSFTAQKNHRFLLHVFKEVLVRRPDAWLLLVGTGPLWDDVSREAELLGVRKQVVFAGSRSDVPALMLAAMNCFVFPSKYEGLGLAAVEAQIACLPSVFSDAVPAEAIISPELVQCLSLSEGPRRWAVTTLNHCGAANEVGAHTAVERAIHSPFNLRSSVAALERAYRGG